MSSLRLRVLGSPEVFLDDRAIKLPTRKSLALLVYLAVQGDPQSREHLAALFWPDQDPPRGRAALRNTLSYLREAIGGARLSADRDNARLALLPADDFDLAVLWRAERDYRSGAPASFEAGLVILDAATIRYRGAFLEGFSLDDAPAYAEWIEQRREDLRKRVGGVFDRLSEHHSASGDVARFLDTAARWVAVDSTNEVAHRRLIQARLAAGDRAGALRAYEACRRMLAEDLDVEPAPETEALAARARLPALSSEGPPASSRTLGPVRHDSPPSGGIEAPLVGRDGAFGGLVEAYHRSRRGQISVVALEGEAGIGKTRLASEFLNWARAEGADVVVGRAFETGGQLPYQSLVDALGRRLDQENAPEDLLGDAWLAELGRLLPELRERYPDLVPAPVDDGTGHARLFEAVAQLNEALARRAPVVLSIDDLQWADRESLDLLRFVARRIAERRLPILLVLALRTEALATSADLAEWLASLGRDIPVSRIALRSLTIDEVQLLLARFGVRGDVTEFARRLYGETRGQPFFLTETIRDLVDRGVLLPAEGSDGRPGFILAASTLNSALSSGSLPSSVRQMIAGRLARLGSAARDLLVASSVLGQRGAFEMLCRVAGLTEDEGLRALDEAIGRQLLIETRLRTASASPAVYLHAHDKIRDVVYTDAGDARRRVFHRRAFGALRDAGASAAELAHHAVAAGLAIEAFRFSVAAGEESARVFALRDAIDHFQRARDVLADHPPSSAGISSPETEVAELTGRLFLGLGRAHELLSQRESARAAYEGLLLHARESRRQVDEFAALNRLAMLIAQNGVDFDSAMVLLEAARTIAEASGDRQGLAETEWNLAQMGVYQSNPSATLYHGERALEIARAEEAPELIARSLNALSYAHRNLGRWEASATTAAEAAEIYAQLDIPALEIDSLGMLASSQIKSGQLREGIRSGRRALALSLEIENPWGQVASAYHLTPGLVDAGLYAEAREVAVRGTATARTRATRPMLIFSLIELGSVYRALLALDQARETHREAFTLSEGLSPLFHELCAVALCADEALAGRWDQAAEFARQALDARGFGLHQTGLTRWLEYEALVRAGRPDLAEADCRRFGEHLGANPRFRIPYLRCLAVLARARGNSAEAITHLHAALNLAHELGLPGEGWSIEVAIAEAHAARNETEQARQARERGALSVQALADGLDPPTREAFLTAATWILEQNAKR